MYEHRKQLKADELTAYYKVVSALESQRGGNDMSASILGLYDNVGPDPKQIPNQAMARFNGTAACVATTVEGLNAGHNLVEKRTHLDLDYRDRDGNKHSLGLNQEEARNAMRDALGTLEAALERDYPVEYRKAKTTQQTMRSA